MSTVTAATKVISPFKLGIKGPIRIYNLRINGKLVTSTHMYHIINGHTVKHPALTTREGRIAAAIISHTDFEEALT